MNSTEKWLGVFGLIVAIFACIGTYLAVPQFRDVVLPSISAVLVQPTATLPPGVPTATPLPVEATAEAEIALIQAQIRATATIRALRATEAALAGPSETPIPEPKGVTGLPGVSSQGRYPEWLSWVLWGAAGIVWVLLCFYGSLHIREERTARIMMVMALAVLLLALLWVAARISGLKGLISALVGVGLVLVGFAGYMRWDDWRSPPGDAGGFIV